MEDVIPVYSLGYFHITPWTIHYTIVYDYIERTPAVRIKLKNPRDRREEEEHIAKTLGRIMREEEKTVINGRHIHPTIDLVRIELKPRRTHYVVVHARMDYTPVEGRNVYENFYQPTTAPYSYTAYWITPPGGEIVSVETPGTLHYTGDRRIAVIHVRKGTRLDGYEAVVFRLPPQT
jgi:hypothetical protein